MYLYPVCSIEVRSWKSEVRNQKTEDGRIKRKREAVEKHKLHYTMTEEFLHYLWKYRLYDAKNLKTTEGVPVTVVKPGIHNKDAGPDFFDARIRIGKTLWVGNVEIHINASSWNEHNHQRDPAYNNVVMHVVYTDDMPVKNAANQLIPTLALNHLIDTNFFRKYEQLIKCKQWIACQSQVKNVDDFVKNKWLERIGAERLERKSIPIQHDLKFYNNNWQDVFYIHLSKYLGMKINAAPFTLLAKSLPLNLLAKHKNDRFQLEALLYGTAGMLNESFTDPYPLNLKKEYAFLSKKYSLQALDNQVWKFFRLRPPAFPTLRISMLAGLIFKSDHLFSTLLEIDDTDQFFQFFDVSASPYWDHHYRFEKPAKESRKKLGVDSIETLLINTVTPFLFLYGIQKDNQAYRSKAIKLLEKLSPEKNSITKNCEKLGFVNKTAFDSQALLELKEEYCDKKKCLDCMIGDRLLRAKN